MRGALQQVDGSFAIDELPAGGWRLEARGVGFLPLRTTLDFVDDSEVEVWMVMQPASYMPSPLDLMPEEEPLPPTGLGPRPIGE